MGKEETVAYLCNSAGANEGNQKNLGEDSQTPLEYESGTYQLCQHISSLFSTFPSFTSHLLILH